MPSVVKFLIILAVLAVAGYASLFALATFVEPEPKETTIRIPAKDLRG